MPDTPSSAAGASPDNAVKSDDKSNKKDSKDVPMMHVRVASPFKVFYDEDALALSGENGSGPFDILPHHHNFISLLNECELKIKTQAGDTRVRISGGIMHVKADQIVVFLNV